MTPAPTKPSEALRADLADEVLPLYRDVMGDEPCRPHPDGRPWRKACGECAFRREDPQDYGPLTQGSLRETNGDTHFYCLHRQERARNRVCASYAAIQRGLRRAGQ